MMEKDKDLFIKLLLSTKREGVENVLKELEMTGFYHASLPTHRHLVREGGLFRHSLNVYFAAEKIATGIMEIKEDVHINRDSLAITALLHDVCKIDGFPPLGHGEKSVMLLLQWGLDLRDEEMLAIRWHMGAWDLSHRASSQQDYLYACQRYPLVSVLQAADTVATFVMEA